MAKLVQFEGAQHEFPDDFNDADIAKALSSVPPAAQPAAPAAPAPVAAPATGPVQAPRYDASGAQLAPLPPQQPAKLTPSGQYLNQTGAILARETRRGAANLAGAPVDLVNWILSKTGLPVSNRPVGGSTFFDEVAGAPATALSAASNAVGVPSNPNPQPQDAFQRGVGRVGNEIGASLLPLGGTLIRGPQVGVQAARTMAAAPSAQAAPSVIPGAQAVQQLGNDVAGAGRSMLGQMYETAAVAPAQLAKREMGMATAAGTGAGVANEIAGNPQQGDNFWSDFLGSLGGVGLSSAAGGTAKAIGNMGSAVFGGPTFRNSVVDESAASQLIANSAQMQQQARRTGGNLDTAPLVRQLRTEAPVEAAVPGYQANIADRTQDPGLANFAFNTDARTGGAYAARRANNEAAVNERMTSMAPAGDPATLRAEIEANRQRTIAAAQNERLQAQGTFDQANQGIQPQLREAEARGSQLRSVLQEKADTANASVRQQYAPLDNAPQPTDISPLVDLYARRDQSLPMNDRQRFRPTEADVPGKLAPPQSDAPVQTGILGPDGAPISRPPDPVDTTVPLKELMAIRSGLAEDVRLARPAGKLQEAQVKGGYLDDVAAVINNAIPPELRQAYDAARAASKDYHDRFTRPGDAIAETLRRKEGGGYALTDSAVPPKFTPTDQGKLTDYHALVREAGTDPRTKSALSDQIFSEVQQRGLVNNPEGLSKYMAERSVIFGDFPDLRSKLEAAGASKAQLDKVAASAADTERRLTTPGQSVTANYLKYGDERTTDSVRTVLAADKPGDAAKELLRVAGDTPEARLNARTALWEEVKRIGREQAPGATGEVRWNGKRLAAMFRDPKVDAVAKELWSDAPQELADIKKVFSSLEGAEGSGRARVGGSSGTAQALNGGKFDASLSAASVASRMRSVNRGQLSPSIAIVDLASTWLRNKSASAQGKAIDNLMSELVNNPGLAADLLQKYNPADYAAKRRMITQKYGVRATQTLNLLDEAHHEDPTKDAVMKK